MGFVVTSMKVRDQFSGEQAVVTTSAHRNIDAFENIEPCAVLLSTSVRIRLSDNAVLLWSSQKQTFDEICPHTS
ncbi:hypothetical protein Tco_0505243 [Tanacetum coccineum]